MGLQKAPTSRILTPVTLDLTARDTPDQERLDIPALSATNSSSSPLTLPLVAEAMVATSNLLPSHLSRTLDTVIPTDRPPHHPADFPRITSHLMSTPEHTWDLAGFQTTPIATGCPLLLLLSSPSMLRPLHLSLRILLLLLLTNIQVKHLPQRVRRLTSRCTPRTPRTVEVSSQELRFSPSAFTSDSNPLASPAGTGQQPSGFAPQVQQYGDAPNPRASVPPQSAPVSSSSSSKRRSDRDDDRHTPSDRHSRQARR